MDSRSRSPVSRERARDPDRRPLRSQEFRRWRDSWERLFRQLPFRQQAELVEVLVSGVEAGTQAQTPPGARVLLVPLSERVIPLGAGEGRTLAERVTAIAAAADADFGDERARAATATGAAGARAGTGLRGRLERLPPPSSPVAAGGTAVPEGFARHRWPRGSIAEQLGRGVPGRTRREPTSDDLE